MKQKYTDVQVPLNKLVLHPRNVRAGSETAYAEDSIRPLAANIRERGLLQPLIVQKLEDGTFGVIGGGRRRAALNTLAADKSAKGFTKTMKVACREVDDKETALSSVSYSENALQLPMDMVERYEAFAAMRDQDGADITTIARSFAITDRTVREALRLGNIHPDIRAAYKSGEIALDALKAFDAHPDPAVQRETFEALKEEHGSVSVWRVGQAFQNRFVRQGDKLGAFVLEAYQEEGGEIIPDLIEEDSILSDSTLVNKVLEQKLSDLAEEKRAELGFAWAEARTDVDWDTFQDYGRVYPKARDLDDKQQAKVDKLIEEMDAVSEAYDAATTDEEEDQLEARHDALNAEHDALTTGYLDEDLANAGVIAIWQHGEMRFNIGFVRPEDKPSPKSGTGGSAESASDEVPHGPKISAKLSDDMAHVRTRAVGLALAQCPDLARDYAEFTLVTSILGRAGGFRNTTTLRGTKASYCEQEPEGSLQQIEEVFDTLNDGLQTDWTALDAAEAFAAFRALPNEARGALLAFAVAESLEPRTASSLGDPVREAVEREALPNIRDIWTPDAVFLQRLTKPDLLTILRDVGLTSEASVYANGKKSNLVDYMAKLFAEPFATLTPSQLELVKTWAPDLMAHPALDAETPDAPDVEGPEDRTPVAAE